jgi:Carbohydrate esterase, sialic acid-specific acetylesterase
MKLRSLAAFSLALICGTGLGIGLQQYFGLSDKTGSLLQRMGLASAPTEVLAGTASEPAIADRLQGRLKLYVLVGQSNMAGVAEIPSEIQTSANIFTFGNDYRWERATEPVDNPANQVDSVSADTKSGFGPAFTFAKTMVEQDSNQLIGLIPCAKEGSSITDWQRNLSDETLYGSCLKRVRAASVMGEVSGILFFQGEADTIDPQQFPALQPDAEAWAEKFALFAYSFRQDVGNPNLPLVYAQLGQPQDLEGLPNWALVRSQQENIQIPNAAMIETADLPMESLHFTVDSYKVIGQRFADAINLMNASRSGLVDSEALNPDGESLAAESAQEETEEVIPTE